MLAFRLTFFSLVNRLARKAPAVQNFQWLITMVVHQRRCFCINNIQTLSSNSGKKAGQGNFNIPGNHQIHFQYHQPTDIFSPCKNTSSEVHREPQCHKELWPAKEMRYCKFHAPLKRTSDRR